MQAPIQTKENILALIRENDAEIKALGVARLRLFGSFLRGEQNATSDLDFLAEFEPEKKSYENLEQLKNLLRNLSGRTVQVIPADALDQYIGPYILRDIESGGTLKMKKSPLPYLQHILDEATLLERESTDMTRDDFEKNELKKRAFVRSLEIMGEATKNLSPEFRKKYDQVDWKGMAGMRDRLIHGYDFVDYEKVWQVVTDEIPPIRQEIEHIIAAETNSDE